MTQVVRACSDASKAVVGTAVRDLLVEVDVEFLPYLSARTDTLSMKPGSESTEPGLPAYFEAMRLESWLIALRGESVVGLISFITDNQDAALAAWSPSLYATTVAVSRRTRRAGVGTALYNELKEVAHEQVVPFLTTRTWTTNDDHLRFLLASGFRRVIEVPGDRAPGIGTVYLAYPVGHLRC